MRAHIIRRLLLIIPTLFILSILVFLSVRFIPGDVIDVMMGRMEFLGAGGMGVDREALEKMLGLDQPVYVQYGRWLGDILLHGSLGRSLMGDWAVEEKILGRFPVTIELGFLSIVIGLLIALPVGIYSAIRQDTAVDYAGRSIAVLGLATPNFWLALMVMIYPAIWWGWSPPMRLITFSEDPLGNLGMFLIPSLILGTASAAATMRMTRTMMLEVLRQDYIRTAWSKGLKERVVVVRHAVKNVLIPVVTLIGMQLPILVGGAVIIENIFNLPGLGRLMLVALSDRDFPVVAGINLVFATAVMGINLMIDLLYALLGSQGPLSVMGQNNGRTRFLTRLVREKPLGTASGIIALILILVAVFADVIAPYPIGERHLPDRLQGSSAQYLLGTDHLGRDVLSRIIHGARISLTVGLAATTLNVLVAVLLGGTSGFLGGRLDLVVQRFVDAWMSFPGLLLLLTIISMVGKGLLQLILVLGISGGIVGSRVLRSAVIGIKENDYFQSAVTIGASKWRILLRHVLPNIAAPIIVVFSINVGGVIISEAALSFLGFGLPIEIPSWGGLLSREGRQYMETAPHLAFWPGLALTITVYCFNMFGDAVRDLLDPRLIGGAGRLGAHRTEGARSV